MTYYCKKCDNNSWSAPFDDNLCDTCWNFNQMGNFAIIFWHETNNNERVYPLMNTKGQLKTFKTLAKADNYANNEFGENARVIKLATVTD